MTTLKTDEVYIDELNSKALGSSNEENCLQINLNTDDLERGNKHEDETDSPLVELATNTAVNQKLNYKQVLAYILLVAIFAVIEIATLLSQCSLKHSALESGAVQ